MKKRMKKLTAIICLISLAAAAAGCGNNSSADTADTVTESEDTTAANDAAGSYTSGSNKNGTESEAAEAATEEAAAGFAEDAPLAESAPAIRVISYYDEDLYNLTTDGFQIVSDGFDALKNSIHKHNVQMKEEALTYKDTLKDEEEWTYSNTASIARCDTCVFSGSQEAYADLGQSDPMIRTTGYTFDVYSGTELTLLDILKDTDLFTDAVIAKLKTHPDAAFFNDGWEDTISGDLPNLYDLSWYLSDDALKLVFTGGILNATSEIELEIPYTECSTFMKDRYTKQSGLLCHKVDDYGDSCQEYTFDADGDGKEELLQIDADYETDDDHYVIAVTPVISFGRDADSLTTVRAEEEGFYQIYGSWVMQSAEGKYYLYVETLSDNDHHVLLIYDISDPDAGPVSMGINETGAFYGFTQSDPNGLSVMNSVYYMGTYMGYIVCHIGENGQLQTEGEPEYRILSYDQEKEFNDGDDYGQPAVYLTLLKDITEYVYDINSGDGQNETIKAGTKLYPYACSPDAYMIFKIEDGKYVTLYYDDMSEDNPERKIKEIPEEELLDGMIYAG